jgi:hypothetical protein
MLRKSGMDIEQRIYELLENLYLRGSEIVTIVAAEYGVTRGEAFQSLRKVLRERGTPQHARTMEILERLATVRL